MHNVGLLLLGHLFPSDLHALNQAVVGNPGVPLINIERRLFMTDHSVIGTWLMQKWEMPEEVITVVKWHHDESYRGENAVYANLALLADRLLQRLGKGDDAGSVQLPPELLADVGLEEADSMDAIRRLLESRSDLASLASQMGTTHVGHHPTTTKSVVLPVCGEDQQIAVTVDFRMKQNGTATNLAFFIIGLVVHRAVDHEDK
jgi:HD-like signal output (HDOD) protein